MNDFKEVLADFTVNRVLEIVDSIVIKKENYTKITRKMLEIHKEIKKQLSQEYKYLIDEYELISSQYTDLCQETTYEQGLRDGVKLKDFLEK